MNTDIKKIIGSNIRAKREALGMSQEELAQKAGKQTATYIAFIEKGQRNISTVDLLAIAKQLGTTVSSLIGEEKTNKKTTIEALRSSTDLTPKDRKQMETFFHFIIEQKRKEKK